MGAPDLIMIDEPTEVWPPRSSSISPRDLDTLKSRRCIGACLVEQKLTIDAARSRERCYVMGTARSSSKARPTTLRANAEIRKEWLEV